jgi:alpha-mannosidase
VGELYLEYHRGTYTSQAAVKRANRKAEFLLQAGEQASTLANLLMGASYPREQITKAWEVTLLNQFHDIIPGSSIHEVYEDAAVDYAQIFSIGDEVLGGAMSVIVEPGSTGVVLYNPLSWERTDVAEVRRVGGVGGQEIITMDGEPATLVELQSTPSLGYHEITKAQIVEDDTLSISTTHIENRFFKIVLDDNAEIISLLDKRNGREVIDSTSYCRGNALLSFEDRPMEWNAWDIDIYYQDKMTQVQSVASVQVVETGPIRASLEIVRKFGQGSTLRQRISIYRNLDRIDFDTEVDWQERQTLLKVAFPVNVRSSFATYDIQFGNVTRSTHWNTSWDWARFETCAHKWADLSEGDYGVSMLSDCKYGWDIRDNVMRLTLLRGPISPDPEADLGRHRFCYSLYPHAGDWRVGGTVRRAYEFNAPVRAKLGSVGAGLPKTASLLSVDRLNLIVETIKMAEDDDALIVRLFECYGQRGEGQIDFGSAPKSVTEVNLLEKASDETSGRSITVDGGVCRFDYKPYEIITFKVTPGEVSA